MTNQTKKAMYAEDYIELFVTLLRQKGLYKEFLQIYQINYKFPLKLYFRVLIEDPRFKLEQAVFLAFKGMPCGKWVEVSKEWQELIK